MRVYFYQPLWENCPALWQLVTDKEFLIKIEISNHPQSSQPSEFQSSKRRRLVLGKKNKTVALGSSIVGFLVAVINEGHT